MKKTIASIIALFCGIFLANAVPATPYPFKYRQPDGSVITLRLHGDEFYHYTTAGGQAVALGKDAFYHPCAKPSFNKMRVQERRDKVLHRPARSAVGRRVQDPINMGDKHFLVLLIEFKDIQFTVENAAAAFTSMLNAEGYSGNGGTGSAADYYKDNSMGLFRPVFDVYGPVQVSKDHSEYGVNVGEDDYDKDPGGLLSEACRLLDGIVDFSQYDLDKDGYVDNIFFYFAGHNEAEGAGADYIWPHASSVSDGTALDGVYIWSYACTSEYRGANGTKMAGIGTFCHEFGHVLGLPDFYDTDYEENGTADDVMDFSLMGGGAYNNSGRTPPYLNSLERWLLDWGAAPQLPEMGSVSLKAVQYGDCAMTPTSVDGEFFLYEVRDGTGWDRYVLTRSISQPPKGMVIYHVDMSDNLVGEKTAKSLWSSNELNCYKVHPCCYIVKASNSYNDYSDLLWPGTRYRSEFEGTEWAGTATGFKLSEITYSDGSVSFMLSQPTSKAVVGIVSNSSGNPLSGVLVESGEYSTHTGDDGSYRLEFPMDAADQVELSFSLPMHRSKTFTVRLVTSECKLDVTLLNIAEHEPLVLSKHGPLTGMIGFQGGSEKHSGTIAVRYKAAELGSYVGYAINKINFTLVGSNAEQVDAFVDFGNKRMLTRKVDSPESSKFTAVDISDAGIKIPAGQDIYVGIAVKNIPFQYWIGIDNLDPVDGGGMIQGDFYSTTGSDNWYGYEYNFIIDFEICETTTTFELMSLRSISNPGKGKAYAPGTVLPLKLDDAPGEEQPQKVEWSFDGVRVQDSVTLSAGKHSLKAVLTYSDGSEEEIEQIILVQ